MPYDPRMMQMAQAGIGMMSPQFDRNAPQQRQQPKQWWEQEMRAQPSQPGLQPLPYVSTPGQDQGQMQTLPYTSRPGQSPPSLLQLLMLGGQPTYSGTPRPGGGGYR